MSLKDRRIEGVELIISNNLGGLGVARRAVFGGKPWQSYQYHLKQNGSAHVPGKTMKMEVASDIRAIFNAPDRQTVEDNLHMDMNK